jgi:competence protein ComEA
MLSAPRYQVDLNRASVAEFQALPEIGPRLAERIVRDREANGPFLGPEQLSRVRGVGPATLERIGPYLQYQPPWPASAAAPQPSEMP